ncbi:uncharacterized protein F5147DRAFT_770163 [Suillus discolor]|uniref:Uncharacterized protein n=1 Tax=Suillus discolor TaxID=1912936 RepID=A0A9P7FE48_9AGAM|nr:uncharacterized protein F5147DRAFT_770163 [Suillus discolor]KAG2114170.1 hypothetical protein F5147DRAFT_770163 [Suillus discolor]
MAPFDSQPIKSLPAPRDGNIVVRSYQTGSMNRHTIIDVVIITVIFIALLLSLSALACFRPTSLNPFRAVPVRGTSVPIINTATPMRSTATTGRSIHYSRHILMMSFILHNWWARTFHDGIPRSVNTAHHEPTLFRAAPLSAHPSSAIIGPEFYPRSPSFTTFAPTSLSGTPSIVNTFVDSGDVELHELDGSKSLSTPSLAAADDADIADNRVVMLSDTEFIVSVDAKPEAPDPS